MIMKMLTFIGGLWWSALLRCGGIGSGEGRWWVLVNGVRFWSNWICCVSFQILLTFLNPYMIETENLLGKQRVHLSQMCRALRSGKCFSEYFILKQYCLGERARKVNLKHTWEYHPEGHQHRVRVIQFHILECAHLTVPLVWKYKKRLDYIFVVLIQFVSRILSVSLSVLY